MQPTDTEISISPYNSPFELTYNSQTNGAFADSIRASFLDAGVALGTNTSQTFYINGSQVGSTINEGAGGTTHWGWGNNDIVTPPYVGEEFHKLIPNSTLHFVDKCGHAPMMEVPTEFNQILEAFLNQLSHASSTTH